VHLDNLEASECCLSLSSREAHLETLEEVECHPLALQSTDLSATASRSVSCFSHLPLMGMPVGQARYGERSAVIIDATLEWGDFALSD
jgi:hypothetical protein